MKAAVNYSGDSGSMGVMAGNAIGADLGVKKFPRNTRSTRSF